MHWFGLLEEQEVPSPVAAPLRVVPVAAWSRQRVPPVLRGALDKGGHGPVQSLAQVEAELEAMAVAQVESGGRLPAPLQLAIREVRPEGEVQVQRVRANPAEPARQAAW